MQNVTSKVLSACLRVLIIFSDICSYFTFFYAENLFLSIRRQDTFPLLPNARALAIFSNFLFSH